MEVSNGDDHITFASVPSNHPHVPQRQDTNETIHSFASMPKESRPYALRRESIEMTAIGEVEEAGQSGKDERDFKKRQEFEGRSLFW